MKIENIWLSAADRSQENPDPDDCNTDVVVEFDNGGKWVASLFTYKYMARIVEKHKASGEYLEGRYFWAKGMMLIENCKKETVKEVVQWVLDEGDFKDIFIPITKPTVDAAE